MQKNERLVNLKITLNRKITKVESELNQTSMTIWGSLIRPSFFPRVVNKKTTARKKMVHSLKLTCSSLKMDIFQISDSPFIWETFSNHFTRGVHRNGWGSIQPISKAQVGITGSTARCKNKFRQALHVTITTEGIDQTTL